MTTPGYTSSGCESCTATGSRRGWQPFVRGDRQRRDVTAMINVQRSTLDIGYLRRWAEVLDITDELDVAVRIAEHHD